LKKLFLYIEGAINISSKNQIIMKKSFFFLSFLFCFSTIYAQAPQGINYQAVARDGDGGLLAEMRITVQFEILSGSTDGPAVYEESHNVTTNAFGLFSAVIGQGDATSGSFAKIDWSADSYFLKVSVDGTVLGTTQFMSVPYALSTAPRRGIATVPGAVFHPNTDGPSWSSSTGQGGAEIDEEGGTSVNVLVAPITLPHGARLTRFTAYFKDESADQDLSIILNREVLNSGIFDPVETIETSGSDSGWRSASLEIDHLVDNNNYGYFIRIFTSNWDAEGAKAIKGVKVEYVY